MISLCRLVKTIRFCLEISTVFWTRCVSSLLVDSLLYSSCLITWRFRYERLLWWLSLYRDFNGLYFIKANCSYHLAKVIAVDNSVSTLSTGFPIDSVLYPWEEPVPLPGRGLHCCLILTAQEFRRRFVSCTPDIPRLDSITLYPKRLHACLMLAAYFLLLSLYDEQVSPLALWTDSSRSIQ